MFLVSPSLSSMPCLGPLANRTGVRMNNFSWHSPSTSLAPVTLSPSQLRQPVAAVPEASSLAMGLLGLLAVGVVARRPRPDP